MTYLAEPYVVVVGVGRSGTTLLMSMLDSNSSIAMLPEIAFERRILVKQIQSIGTVSQMVELLKKDLIFSKGGIDPVSVANSLTERDIKYSPVAFYQHLLWLYAHSRNKRLVGVKDPKSLELLPVLKELFPQTRILHIVRDPRDVFLSRKKAEWSKDRADFLQLLAYRAQYSLGSELGPKLFGRHYLEIQYEALISMPEDVLKRVCEFLEIGFEPQMLDHTRSSHRLVSIDEKQYHGNVYQPVLANNKNKWMGKLTKGQVVGAEYAGRKAMRVYSYENANFRKSLRLRVYLLALGLSLEVANSLYCGLVYWQNCKAVTELSRYNAP